MLSVLTCVRPGGISYLKPLIDTINKVCPTIHKVLACDGEVVEAPGWNVVPCGPFSERLKIDNKFPGWQIFEIKFLKLLQKKIVIYYFWKMTRVPLMKIHY
jgi:hypothetical protein